MDGEGVTVNLAATAATEGCTVAVVAVVAVVAADAGGTDTGCVDALDGSTFDADAGGAGPDDGGPDEDTDFLATLAAEGAAGADVAPADDVDTNDEVGPLDNDAVGAVVVEVVVVVDGGFDFPLSSFAAGAAGGGVGVGAT